MQVWSYPTTWKVGDTLNAANMNTRIGDQNTVLLRRPLLVAHNSIAGPAIKVAGSGNTNLSFDTVDQDDDGMVIQTLPTTDFYVQRAGTYQVWLNVTFSGPAAATDCMSGFCLNNGPFRWQVQGRIPGFSGTGFSHSISGTMFLNVGEIITPQVWNGAAVTLNMQAVNNTPRVQIMWLGVT
jgi:hypothetical protein